MNAEGFTLTHPALPDTYRNLSHRELGQRIQQAKERLGRDLVIMGHHYQRDDVIQFADFTGDSLELARIAEQQRDARSIVFCGVHFMAETADILTGEEQIVILPDMQAGCSMADMADIDELEEAWEVMQEELGDTILPVTYVNSTAAIKAFVGRHGGTTCTSSNARGVLEWAFARKKRILFLPDQHLGRNTAYAMGIPLEQMAVWDPIGGDWEAVQGPMEDLRVLLWKGHCSVHTKFTVDQIREVREQDPETRVIVHPECTFDVVQAADEDGSTSYIIRQIESAPAGSKWAVGTEVNLVQRLAQNHPEQEIRLLSRTMCPCLTMNRIDRPHLLWALESLIEGKPVNRVTVGPDTAYWARTALERMLAIV
ncbi:MAG: quinolinate synthase NadA [Firmicutes bacterium]|uniref:Quinolinate synthase n=1 Tax=Melghirimyces thermohalophilus TaxID=1236220 RepID=A0A1G6KL91_9BACL|nr:quinolinate synthase NadA [Melghirimyces thermohalophilus]MDA8354339.1 quinolinate synthase NadA [Bacillota bacterium]SDC31733.1 quinolinate synthetase [Melghirimyces thermohalophilus]